MIKRLTTVEEIAELISIEDVYVEGVIGCTKGEWIQWLMRQAENERHLILAIYKDNKPISYIVASNVIVLPV